MSRLIMVGLVRPIGWIIIGLIVIGVGGYLYLSAHVIHPVEVDGQFSSVTEVLQDNSYDHTEIVLDGRPITYTFNKNEFTPAWPDEFLKDGQVQLFVDQGTTNVVAFTTYDENQNPTKYTSDLYLHPEHGLQGQTSGLITGGAGAAVTLVAIIWAIIAGGRKRAAKQRQPAAVGAGSNAAIQQQYGGPPPMPPMPGQGQGPVNRQ